MEGSIPPAGIRTCSLCVIFESNPGCCTQIPLSTAHGRKTHHNGKLDASQKRCRASFVGSIRNHQKFPDGAFVRTSVVVASSGRIVTENGSAYMLGNSTPRTVLNLRLFICRYRTPRRRSNKRSAEHLRIVIRTGPPRRAQV